MPESALNPSTDLPSTRSFFRAFLSSSLFALLGWLISAFNLSLLVVIVVSGIYAIKETFYKAKSKHVQSAKAYFKDEQKSIHAALKEVPRWVFYPDIERVDWFNKMLLQLWPDISSYIVSYLKDSLEPLIKSSLPTKFNSFRFDVIDLGDRPPKITGVKVFDLGPNQDEIILDVDVSYAGDSEITCGISKFEAGIKDLQIRGTMRLIFAPLLNDIPFIGGMQIFFINNPEVNFSLTSLAGILDLPGLYEMLQTIVSQQISNYVVLPNKLAFPFSSTVPVESLRFTAPKGLLRIQLLEAADLPKMDIASKSDPYIKFIVGSTDKRSVTINNNHHPKWNNEFFEFVILEDHYQRVTCLMYDEDDSTTDDYMGRCDFSIKDVSDHGHLDSWLPLQEGQGSIRLNCTWLTASKNPQELQKPTNRFTTLSTAILAVYVECAKNLSSPENDKAEVSSLVQLSLDSQNTFSTKTALKTNNPSFNEYFYTPVHNPHLCYLSVNVMDGKTVLGRTTIAVSMCVKAREMTLRRPFLLKSDKSSNSEIYLVLSLKALVSNLPTRISPKSSLDVITPPVVIDPKPEPIEEEEEVMVICPETVEKFESTPAENNNEGLVKRKTTAVKKANQLRRYQSIFDNDVLGEDQQCGKIELTIKHLGSRNKLTVTVGKCLNLPLFDQELPDPYVKLYLLPDKTPQGKRKSDVKKNTMNPSFSESFDFTMTEDERDQRTLEIIVKSRMSMFSRRQSELARVFIHMSALDLNGSHKAWYYLEEPEIPSETTL